MQHTIFYFFSYVSIPHENLNKIIKLIKYRTNIVTAAKSNYSSRRIINY